MPIQRKYDFQPGKRISSSQVDEEFNQLVAQLNQIEADDNKKDEELRKEAQLSKITLDTGAAAINFTDSTKNLLQELIKTPPGFHTFYSVGGIKNSPAGSHSIRGIFHHTSLGHGWIFVIDYVNNIYSNHVSNGNWTGWKKYVSTSDKQETLWEGAAYMNSESIVVPAKKLSECRNGWILMWSDYDPEAGGRNWDFNTWVIPKEQAVKFPGAAMTMPVSYYLDPLTVGNTAKTLYVSDDKIAGHDANNSNPVYTSDVCLRYVIEF